MFLVLFGLRLVCVGWEGKHCWIFRNAFVYDLTRKGVGEREGGRGEKKSKPCVLEVNRVESDRALHLTYVLHWLIGLTDEIYISIRRARSKEYV